MTRWMNLWTAGKIAASAAVVAETGIHSPAVPAGLDKGVLRKWDLKDINLGMMQFMLI